jgi:hypothetical protein
MVATKDRAIFFQTVTYDSCTAGRAIRRERLDRAFETIEGVGSSGHRHLERFVIIIAACLASHLERLPFRVARTAFLIIPEAALRSGKKTKSRCFAESGTRESRMFRFLCE